MNCLSMLMKWDTQVDSAFKKNMKKSCFNREKSLIVLVLVFFYHFWNWSCQINAEILISVDMYSLKSQISK